MHYAHMAEHVKSRGRGEDTMLVHMTPHEVGGLQALAMAHGGSLTINPDTGLPEAGWLGKLLPTILGAAGMAFGIPPIWMGALGAVGGTAITGNLKEGLMAGLGAFGGASLAGAAGLGGAAGHLGSSIGLSGSQAAIMHPLATAATPLATSTAAGLGASAPLNIANGVISKAAPAAMNLASTAPSLASSVAGNIGQQAAKTGLAGIAQNFGNAAKAGLGTGLASKAAVPLATMGVMNSVSGAMTPKAKKGETPVDEYGYTGPYTANRQVLDVNSYANPNDHTELAKFDPTHITSGEKLYFSPTTYTDAAGKIWTPGQKTTPTAANASSAMANPITLTPEQRLQLLGYADGGQVGANQMVSPTQNTPQPAQQMMDGSYSMQNWQSPEQASPYNQPHPNNPIPDNSGGIQNLPGLAGGGMLHMRSGSFVMPARETAEFGNGSSGAGQQVLARLGGTPIHGPGDGVSDSVAAQIDGHQKARVARDEVHFSPEAVARLGGGSHQKGTQKLYALMNKAQKSRKSAKRGQDTGLRAIA